MFAEKWLAKDPHILVSLFTVALDIARVERLKLAFAVMDKNPENGIMISVALSDDDSEESPVSVSKAIRQHYSEEEEDDSFILNLLVKASDVEFLEGHVHIDVSYNIDGSTVNEKLKVDPVGLVEFKEFSKEQKFTYSNIFHQDSEDR